MCANRTATSANERRIRQPGGPDWRDAERAPGGPCAADVADGERHGLWPGHADRTQAGSARDRQWRLSTVAGRFGARRCPCLCRCSARRRLRRGLRGERPTHGDGGCGRRVHQETGLGRHSHGLFRRSRHPLPGPQLPAGGQFEDRHRGRHPRGGDRYRPHPRSADRLASGRLRRHSRCRAQKSLAAGDICLGSADFPASRRYQA